MERFERYWNELERDELFGRLGQFELTARGGRFVLPESPERAVRTSGPVRKRRRIVIQQFHEVIGGRGAESRLRVRGDDVIDLTSEDE